MRVALLAAAALATAVPALAQTSERDVTGPRTLKPWMVACTDLPTTAPPTYKSVIKGVYATDGRYMTAAGYEVMIGRTPDDGLAAGQRYVVRRPQTMLYGFGGSDEGFGRVRTAGTILITAVDEHNARATVEFACAPILAGDYLDTLTEATLPTDATAMVDPDFNDRAGILVGTDGKAVFGDGDTLSVDRGDAQGVAPGLRFAFYRDRRDGMPLYYLGEGVVMHVSEQTSKVVIVKSIDAVTTGDVAVPRRQP